jgi:DNA-binding CsgD family transcriptional regulator
MVRERTVPADIFRVIVDRLTIAVFLFRSERLVYSNAAAEVLSRKLRSRHRIELEVMLRDHLISVRERLPLSLSAQGSQREAVVSLLTASDGEPFYVHVIPVAGESGDVAVSVRGLGSEIDAVRRRYGLSAREAQVAELVLHGYRNTDIGQALGIATATTKKHLSRIFDKVGVNTRSQLQMRLA